jgi:DNA-directed RNA polymerase specialized sigma24 family protein
MSSSPETPTRTTGAHRTHREARDRAAARTLASRPPARYDPYLDGLFTYCLSVLCDHDAAIAALGEALAWAERRGPRVPQGAGERRAWLYALARWVCLRKLAGARQQRQGTHAAGRHGDDRQHPDAAPPPADDVQEERRRQLALLAWPEAAGTTPEQREALELAVRHHLPGHEVAAVLGMNFAAARELLAAAACEVERTRAALAVVETGGCPGVAALTGDSRLVLNAALRRELVRHVDDCPRCRRTAERARPARWPGACVTPAELPVLQAPRTALRAATAQHPRARGAGPRFDRRGFPMDPKDHAARRDRLRARAVTTTVVATVVAAPVLTLWAAYRGTPTGEGHGGPPATAREAPGPGALTGQAPGGGYQNAGNARSGPGTGFGKGPSPDVSVQVVSVAGAGRKDGHLTVAATNAGETTFITLTASGPTPVRWSASTGAAWLYLSRSSGILKPGTPFTIKVYVDHLREPSGRWSARVAIAPAGAVVSIGGYGKVPGPNAPAAPAATRPADPSPSLDPSTGPRPTPTPSTPTAPASPPPSEPPPSSGPPPSPSASTAPSQPPADDGGGARHHRAGHRRHAAAGRR